MGYDFIFISETNLGYDYLPNFKGYRLFADSKKKLCVHGGIAFYIRENYAKFVHKVCYREAHISFRVKQYPKYVFFGVYIQPEGARYFDASMFTELVTDLLDCQSQGLIPYIGGDFNCRIGNPSDLLRQTAIYDTNIDEKTNKHGRTFFKDLCSLCDILPV